MNSYDRLLARLAGRPVDRVPNLDIIMAFGARFIGETLSRYHQDCHVLSAASLAMVEAFQVDVVSSISDSYREAADLGAEIEFPPDDLPVRRRPLLADEAKLTGLKLLAGPGPRTGDTVEGVRLLRAPVGDDIPVQGWVEGALAQANVLRGQMALMYDLSDRPAWVEALLEFCCELEIADWMVDVRSAAATLAPAQSVCGNFDPVQVMLLGTPDRVEAAVLDCLENGGEKYLCAAGCEIPPGTPPDNLRAQANALRLWGAGRAA